MQSSPELTLYRTKKAAVLESLAELQQRSGDKATAVQLLRQAQNALPPPGRQRDESPVVRAQAQRIRAKLSRMGE